MKEFKQFGAIKMPKICGGKIYSRPRTFSAEVHKLSIRVESSKTQLVSTICLPSPIVAALQTYKVEEELLGQPLYKTRLIKLPLRKSLGQGDQKSSSVMKLGENSCRNHESLR